MVALRSNVHHRLYRVLNEYLGGIMLRYIATHGKDDDEHLNEEQPSPQDL